MPCPPVTLVVRRVCGSLGGVSKKDTGIQMTHLICLLGLCNVQHVCPGALGVQTCDPHELHLLGGSGRIFKQEDCNDPKANDIDSDDNVVLQRKRKLETQPALQADSSKMRKTIATTGLADFVAKMRCMQMRFLLCSLSCCCLLF